MVKKYFDRGDIVRVSFQPSIGHETKGETRLGLVLTTKESNHLGDVLVAPITQGGDFSRFAGFATSLTGTGCKTQSVVLINKIRMLDLNARQAKKLKLYPKKLFKMHG